jgi:hypothetical protein
MRKLMFAAGFAAGFIAGARAGREKYDQIVKYSQQVAQHPKVQQATTTVTTKTTEFSKTAASKAPDFAKSAATSVSNTVSAQMPKIKATAKQAGGRLPFGGKPDTTAEDELAYPVDSGQSPVNGVRYTPD